MQILERPSTNGHASGHVEAFTVDPKRHRRPWRIIIAAVAALALLVTGVLVYRVRSAASVAYVTAPVAQSDLVQTVTATGTVNPQNTISVGTEVSGTISEVDVDYNSKVRKGQVLARIDPTALQAQLDSAKATLAQSEAQAAAAQSAAQSSSIGIDTASAAAQAAAANARAAQATAQSNEQAIATAQAGVTKAVSAEQLAQQTVNRDQSLIAQGYIPQSQLDTDRSNLVAAQTAVEGAQVAVAQARSQAVASQAQATASTAQTASSNDAIVAARAQAAGSADSAVAGNAAIAIQAAAVQQAETNLQHSVITSPVDGTVIARDVSVGTTVAASLQTPTLFSIAQDLNKMEVDLAVGEPDIGSVHAGEDVGFSVLAYPNRTFTGTVSQVRKDPVTTNNVVTYTTVVLVQNNDQALLPGMTANATISVQKATNALVVPLAALSYAPAFSGTHAHHGSAATAPAGSTTAAPAGNAASPWGATTGSATAAIVPGSQSRIFVLRAGKLTRVPVSVTLVTGTQAAVVPVAPANLSAGDTVVTGSSGGATTAHAARPASNPLTGGNPAGGALRGIH